MKISQRHETLGTTKLYEWFMQNKVTIKRNVHDVSRCVGKVIAENSAEEDWDLWHVIKSDIKQFSKIVQLYVIVIEMKMALCSFFVVGAITHIYLFSLSITR